jgi:hypothetical protein
MSSTQCGKVSVLAVVDAHVVAAAVAFAFLVVILEEDLLLYLPLPVLFSPHPQKLVISTRSNRQSHHPSRSGETTNLAQNRLSSPDFSNLMKTNSFSLPIDSIPFVTIKTEAKDDGKFALIDGREVNSP